jgi:hypothetical protein
MNDAPPIPSGAWAALRKLRKSRETGQFCLHIVNGEIRGASFQHKIPLFNDNDANKSIDGIVDVRS